MPEIKPALEPDKSASLHHEYAGLLEKILLLSFPTACSNSNGNLMIDGNSNIELPFGTYVNNRKELYDAIFPNLSDAIPTPNWPSQRAMLAPKNDDVHFINDMLTRTFPGEHRIYTSIDTVMDEDEAVNYPLKFLNSLTLSCFPHHILWLNVRFSVMLLRNLDAPKLCNDTRLSIKQMLPSILEAEIVTGTFKGVKVFIPRIPLIYSESKMQFKRMQFTIKACCAFTIN